MNFVVNCAALSLSCHKLLLSPKNLILRRISVFGKIKGKPALLDKSNHKVIYDFKYIFFVAGISKLKYILPVVSVPFISASFYFNQPTMAGIITVASCLQFILVLGVSRLTADTIGKIYVNKEGKINNVIISSIDSNGTRIDASFPPNQFYLFDVPFFKHLGFIFVECDSKTYKLNVRSAQIQDIKALKSVFHDILLFMNLKYIGKNKKK